jgi:hypothetical protein
MRATLRGWRLGLLLVAVVVAVVGVQVAYAAVTGVTATSGGAVAAVAVARGTDATDTTSGTYVALPGARLTMRGRGLLLIRFTAESECDSSGSPTGDYCSVKILVDGVQAKPNSGFDYAFDTDDGGSWEGNAMDRSIKVGAGLHTIQVFYGVTNGTVVDFRLDDWSLTVERAIA